MVWVYSWLLCAFAAAMPVSCSAILRVMGNGRHFAYERGTYFYPSFLSEKSRAFSQKTAAFAYGIPCKTGARFIAAGFS